MVCSLTLCLHKHACIAEVKELTLQQIHPEKASIKLIQCFDKLFITGNRDQVSIIICIISIKLNTVNIEVERINLPLHAMEVF